MDVYKYVCVEIDATTHNQTKSNKTKRRKKKNSIFVALKQLFVVLIKLV